jgi:single-stranded DNA-binding protein
MAPWVAALNAFGAATRPEKCPLKQHRQCAWRKKQKEFTMPQNSTRIIAEGRLACDPVTHMDGRMTRFSLAIDDDYKGPDGTWIEQTIFLETQTWNSTAERVRAMALKKGDKVAVTGMIKQSQDKEQKTLWTKIWANSVNLLERYHPKPKAEAAQPQPGDDLPPLDPRAPEMEDTAGSDDVPW